MSIQKINVTIEGVSPLLMHAFPLTGTPDGYNKWEPERQAEFAAYRVPETGQLYIPGINIQRCLVSGAAYSKGRGRSTLAKPVAACVMVSPEYCILDPQDYRVDSRPVVNHVTRGRLLSHRPRFDHWRVSFCIEYDDMLLKATELRRVVDDAGSRVGVLDFRPERKGPFGRFMVIKWE